MGKSKLLIFIVFILMCSGAHAQFGKFFEKLDLNKAGEAVKSVGAATKTYTDEEESDIGRGLAGRILGQVELVPDPNVQAYVNRVGRWVASRSERPDLPWRFGVVNAGNINAMAMPGGYILITRGLYDLLDNEAELAGVIGHEIAHVVKRHHINVMRNQNWAAAGAAVGSAALSSSRAGNNSLTKDLSQAILDGFKNLYIKGLDKGAELEADSVGVILAGRAGYNPFGLADVLHKINTRNQADESVKFLNDTHPSSTERIENLGRVLAPHMNATAEGKEPKITPVSSRAAVPRQNAAPVAGVKALTNEGATAPASAPAGASTVAPAGANPMDAIKSIKGLFGR